MRSLVFLGPCGQTDTGDYILICEEEDVLIASLVWLLLHHEHQLSSEWEYVDKKAVSDIVECVMIQRAENIAVMNMKGN
jgi:hypothetical protein